MIEYFNEDCMIGMARYPDKYFDLVLTDPPYGVNLRYGTYVDTEENWYDLMIRCVPEMIRVGKMVIFPSCQIKRLKWFYDNFPPDWIISWHKGSTGANAYIGFNDWEPLLVYGKSKKQLYMHDHFYCQPSEKMGNHGHPCPKPVEWAKWIISRATANGDNVLDPFMGSGTTAIACHDLNRNCVGFELDADYYKASKQRLNDHMAQMRIEDMSNHISGEDDKPEQLTLW